MSELQTYLGWKIDFRNPPGEPSGLPPDSMHWKVYKNPVAMAGGGVAAVLLEFADARIRSGVWDHSLYKQDPIGRSKRTGIAAMVGVYGPTRAAERVIQGVTNMHARVNGNTPNGEAYRALDPELLDWVSATAAYGFLTAYDTFCERVSEAEKTQYYAEAAPGAKLYGVQNSPLSTADFFNMMDKLVHRFESHQINTEFLDIVMSGAAAPGTPKYLSRAMARASVSLLPPAVRRALCLGPKYDLSFIDRMTVRTLGRYLNRKPIPGSPPCDASLRIGLPANFLFLPERKRATILAEWRGKVAASPAPAATTVVQPAE
ncbi:MAG: oxygenase MpaB family protein [Hyphomonadaceae bacterium]